MGREGGMEERELEYCALRGLDDDSRLLVSHRFQSEDLSVSLGASFAIEHWANAGFWDELVSGFTKLNAREGPGVRLNDGTISHTTPLGFWKFHQVRVPSLRQPDAPK